MERARPAPFRFESIRRPAISSPAGTSRNFVATKQGLYDSKTQGTDHQQSNPRSGEKTMKKESLQKDITRVRPPRVHLTYDVETGGAIQKKELPFVAGVLADLSG